MAIIINEFEVIPEEPPASAPAQPPAPAPASQRLRPEDIEQIVTRKRVRCRRIHAD